MNGNPLKNKHRYLLLICILFLLTNVIANGKGVPKPPSVIFMISDGFGPASETFARQYYSWKEGLPVEYNLPLDEVFIGQSHTRSSSHLITDSAAGATAFSCGLKSFNGAIGVDSNYRPCGTVMEAAKLQHNMKTGLVVRSRVTHATPASFSTHVQSRIQEDTIAEQQIGHNPLGRTVDLMFGGGLCYFTSNSSESSCRHDNRDLISEAKTQYGWDVKTTLDGFYTLTEESELPILGLFADQHMNYAIDNDPYLQPSLTEMSIKALGILDRSSKLSGTGFFLMIEGSRIDMAAHSNDPATMFHEILEYQQTVELILQYVKNNPNTIFISTSDHETGGLTIGRQNTEVYPLYVWNPEVISKVKKSSEILSRVWINAVEHGMDTEAFLVNDIVKEGLGIDDLTPNEIQSVLSWKESSLPIEHLITHLSNLVSTRANIGWTTRGHTAVDVNVYASGTHTELLQGSYENTYIGDFITQYLNLDLNDINRRLQ
ncbi:alkaline-phosphatase-like protein [Pilobolus umbonatus]|nr:alkaline-phosphatase-like protein [Pilobolus umbonatus]